MKTNLILHDVFLNILRRGKISAEVTLSNGKSFLGSIKGFDNTCVILETESQSQLLFYRSNICSIYSKDKIL